MPQTVASKVQDVDERDFQQEVLERSFEQPVVVDFWAPWCGPCRVLGPNLEQAVSEFNGHFKLVKINVDENPNLAMQYGVQGIPAVKAFRDGRVASEFVGAQPQPAVREFLRKLVPSDADRLVGQAETLELAGRLEAAEATFRQAVEADPKQGRALLGLGGVLVRLGRYEQATQYLDQVPPLTPEADQAQRLLKLAVLHREAAEFDEESALRARLEADPADLETRYRLAIRQASAGEYEAALDNLLDIVRRNRKFRDDGARRAMLSIFEVLGSDDLTRRYQTRLAGLLF